MSTQSERDIQRFDKWASTYDRSILQRVFFAPIQARMLALCDSVASPPRNVLDIGCGTGRLLAAARLRWPLAQFTGVDPAPHMISAAQQLNPDTTFKLSMAEALPIPDNSVDMVLSSMSFHHWADHALAISEIVRVLQPGGLFCLADHNAVLFNLLGERAKSKRQVAALFGAAGLSVVLQKPLWSRFVLITVGRK